MSMSMALDPDRDRTLLFYDNCDEEVAGRFDYTFTRTDLKCTSFMAHGRVWGLSLVYSLKGSDRRGDLQLTMMGPNRNTTGIRFSDRNYNQSSMFPNAQFVEWTHAVEARDLYHRSYNSRGAPAILRGSGLYTVSGWFPVIFLCFKVEVICAFIFRFVYPIQEVMALAFITPKGLLIFLL